MTLARRLRCVTHEARTRRAVPHHLLEPVPEVAMRFMSLTRPSLLVSFVVALASACSSGDGADGQLATDGAAIVSASDNAAIGLSAGAFEAPTSADATLAPSALAVAPPDPGDTGCRTRQLDPSDPKTVIVTLHDCTGLFGRRVVSGTELIHFSAGANGVLHADLHSENLTVDGRPASHVASADIAFDGALRHVTWQGSWQGVSDAGEAVSHSSDLTIEVDTTAHCRTRNGTAETSIGTRQIASTITNVKVCRDADGDAGCPTGSVVHTRVATGKELTVTFDGTDQAEITTPRGASFDLPLTCKE
jgi:hypothetical protein